jgi:hypothetical protein
MGSVVDKMALGQVFLQRSLTPEKNYITEVTVKGEMVSNVPYLLHYVSFPKFLLKNQSICFCVQCPYVTQLQQETAERVLAL